MNNGCQSTVAVTNPGVKLAILLCLSLAVLLQLILISVFYASSYGDASESLPRRYLGLGSLASDPAAPIGDDNIVLTSCGTEDLGVAVAKVRAAVVYITGRRTSSSKDPASRNSISFSPAIVTGDKMGSGIIFDSAGYILTNLHVIADTTDIRVRIFGDSDNSYPCEIVTTNPQLDLAIIKISTPFPLPTATLGNSDMLEVGDGVLTVGCPFNLEQSVTHGVVSDVKRTVTIDGRVYKDLIQTDAAINSGNSGGALINKNGEVVGINVAIYAPNRVYCGVGFAIPINQAKLLMMKVQYVKAATGG